MSYPPQGRVLYAHTRRTPGTLVAYLSCGFHLCDDVTGGGEFRRMLLVPCITRTVPYEYGTQPLRAARRSET